MGSKKYTRKNRQLTENSEGKLNTWINNKQNSDMYCKTLKYEMMKYQYSKMVELV